MFHGIVEENEVHCCVKFIVLTKSVSESDCNCIQVGKLVVEFIFKTSYEVGENEWLGSWLCEVFIQVEFTKGFLGNISSEKTVLE